MSDTVPAPTEGEDSLLELGRNCWRIEQARRAALIVDAADYFRVARAAMLRARSQILLIGWDFDTRIRLVDEGEEGDGEAPVYLGPLLSWLGRRKPGLRIHILAWDGKIYSFLGRGTTMLRLAEWRLLKPRISFRLDGSHPLQGCHHHKIMVIDDSFACSGGIDMTGSRWDTRAHRDDEPGRRRPTTGRHYGPWHDAAIAMDGAAAAALGVLGRTRWALACGELLPPPPRGSDPWPGPLEVHFRDVDIAIARTCGETEGVSEVREIEALFADMIGAARRFVYMESQYFASRLVAEAIARRLAEPDPPEFVIVNPKSAEGWLEEAVMGAARATLMEAVRKADRLGRFRIYSPVTEAGADIYVHAKIMIVDDRMLRVGSANLNNRSMGLDSECDVVLDAALKGNSGVRPMISSLRCGLMAEHLGVEPERVAACIEETGSLIAAVERLRGPGRTLVPFEPPDFSDAAEAIAKSEIADPESASQDFEPMARRRLLRGLPWHR
ncbi:phospholipase D-like domain-containing protein [Sphingosinicella sp. CPCC 101087]|uniref:phospholipase D-like domain-containing protein n=1 Tax=Sphingosinicella sp. CPCC 101087 TaxID=2497754 RepID=UPI00101C7CD9|nr:phospholipase D-like domain-containing protein [Sphingosinicella sp. CPCC 101087]